MDWITQPETWIAFLTLVALELVLGVDNVIFISILAGKLPQEQQQRARTTGIMLAVVTRILLLLSLRWIVGLTDALFSIYGFDVSGRDLVLFGGGLFMRLNDAIIPVIQVTYDHLDINFSYDVNTSSLKSASQGRGGFELGLSFRAFTTNNSSSLNNVRCPRF